MAPLITILAINSNQLLHSLHWNRLPLKKSLPSKNGYRWSFTAMCGNCFLNHALQSNHYQCFWF